MPRSVLLIPVFVALAMGACAVAPHVDGFAAYYAGDYDKAFRPLEQKADSGDAHAMTLVGLMYENGRGVKQDYAEAARWFTQAAKQDYPYAEYDLAKLYANGRWAKQDYAQSYYWYRRVATHNEPLLVLPETQDNMVLVAEQAIGDDYRYGRGVPLDYSAAFDWYQRAAEADAFGSELALASMYELGQGVAQSTAESDKWYERAAHRGYEGKDAEFIDVVKAIVAAHSAWHYPKDAVVHRVQGPVEVVFDYDHRRAIDIQVVRSSGYGDLDAAAVEAVKASLFPEKPADMRDVKHFQILVNYSFNGVNAPADPVGVAATEYNQAVQFYTGQGVAKDVPHAVALIKDAASRGYAPAQFGLSQFYAAGDGLPQDDGLATEWLQKAAQQNYLPAECESAWDTISSGKDDPDRELHIKWLEDAAQAGIVPCMNDLSWFRATTRDARARNAQEAETWINKAVARAPDDPALLDTLAAVDAALGKYDAAVAAEKKAMGLVPQDEQNARFLKVAKEHLDLYASGKAYTSPDY